jgi:hypothetical protein
MFMRGFSAVYNTRNRQTKRPPNLAATLPTRNSADERSPAHQKTLLKGGAGLKANPMLLLMQAHGLALW